MTVKRFITLSLGITGMFLIASAHAQPTPVRPQSQHGFHQPVRNVASFAPVATNRPEWYAGAHFMQNFAFFTETHDAGLNCVPITLLNIHGQPVTYNTCDTVRHSGASQMGFSAFLGRKLDDHWRAELEIGYIGDYSYLDQGFRLRMSAPYAQINITYNTIEQSWGWLYAGVGIGVAQPRIEIEGFDTPKSNASQASLMPALMFGFRTRIADSWFADLGYKFSTFDAGSLKYSYEALVSNDPDEVFVPATFTNEFGWIMNHAIKIGLVHEF
jgi:opacity protein-like surface antigen